MVKFNELKLYINLLSEIIQYLFVYGREDCLILLAELLKLLLIFLFFFTNN